eukprot:12826691-Heterocapsa_arctica.AAC.1
MHRALPLRCTGTFTQTESAALGSGHRTWHDTSSTTCRAAPTKAHAPEELHLAVDPGILRLAPLWGRGLQLAPSRRASAFPRPLHSSSPRAARRTSSSTRAGC